MAAPLAPSTDIYDVAKHLWEAADELRANSHLKAAEYAIPVLGLIFLKFADRRFSAMESELAGKVTARKQIGKDDYHARRVLYLPPEARFSTLLQLKEGDNLGKAMIQNALITFGQSLPGPVKQVYTQALSASGGAIGSETADLWSGDPGRVTLAVLKVYAIVGAIEAGIVLAPVVVGLAADAGLAGIAGDAIAGLSARIAVTAIPRIPALVAGGIALAKGLAGDPNPDTGGWYGPPKPSLSNPDLQKIVDQLYRPGATIGNGGTADAIRDLVGHVQKGRDRIEQLTSWLEANPAAPQQDVHDAQSLLQDLISAMCGHGCPGHH